MEKDYYEILGVPRNADQKAIDAALRKEEALAAKRASEVDFDF